jgi:integrase
VFVFAVTQKFFTTSPAKSSSDSSSLSAEDRIPAQAEVRKLDLEADLKLKATIAILASSGMGIGELCVLRVGGIDFEKTSAGITIPAKNIKIVRLDDHATVRIVEVTRIGLEDY